MTADIDPSSDQDKYRAPALSKGLDILEHLASEAEGMTQVEIAKTLGRTTSEIFRMLMVLRNRGYVELAEDGDRYSLTTKMFEVAHRHPPIKRLTSIAGDAMQRFADRVNQSVHLGILHSGKILVVAQVDCPDNNVTTVRLGAHIPIYHTASGRALAAKMNDEALQRVLKDAGDSPADVRAQFLADLPGVAAKGYCESPSLMVEGVLNLSAPVYDFSGRAVGAVTVPFIRRLAGTAVVSADECRGSLVELCADISRKLGAGAR
jgi:DNA-binding IclR family transcriptional regulator